MERHCCIQRSAHPRWPHLPAQKPRSKASYARFVMILMRFVEPALPAWAVARTPLASMQQCLDETYVKVAGRWVYLYRAIDQYGQVIDVLVSQKRDLAATRQFLTHALQHGPRPAEVNTDRAPAYPRVLDEMLPSACHVVERYANNPVEPIMDG